MSLKRKEAMTHAPDLLLLSQYDPEMGEVAAFEELIGSHGVGGFLDPTVDLHPSEWSLDEDVPLGAPAIYRNIRAWLESIDIPLGKPTAALIETGVTAADAAAAASSEASGAGTGAAGWHPPIHATSGCVDLGRLVAEDPERRAPGG